MNQCLLTFVLHHVGLQVLGGVALQGVTWRLQPADDWLRGAPAVVVLQGACWGAGAGGVPGGGAGGVSGGVGEAVRGEVEGGVYSLLIVL